MAFCQNCGAQFSEGAKFCPSCGTPVQAVEAPAPVQQEAVPVMAAAPAPEPVQAAAPTAVMEKESVPQQPEPQQPAPQQPAYQQPAYQQPVYQQPAPQQPTYQQPVYQQPAPQQPMYQQPVYQQPAPQQPTYQQPVYQQPAPQQSPYQQTIPGNPLTEEQTKKGLAILAYFGILFLIPLFATKKGSFARYHANQSLVIPLFAAKKGSFARYHANQSLVLFIFMVVFNVLSTVLGNILVDISPLLTLVVTSVFSLLVLVLCVFALIGIIHAAKGQRKPVPQMQSPRALEGDAASLTWGIPSFSIHPLGKEDPNEKDATHCTAVSAAYGMQYAKSHGGKASGRGAPGGAFGLCK